MAHSLRLFINQGLSAKWFYLLLYSIAVRTLLPPSLELPTNLLPKNFCYMFACTLRAILMIYEPLEYSWNFIPDRTVCYI